MLRDLSYSQKMVRTVLCNEGNSDSQAIRPALHEAAALRRRKSALRAEAESLAANPEDLAEARRVRDAMDESAVAWTDQG